MFFICSHDVGGPGEDLDALGCLVGLPGRRIRAPALPHRPTPYRPCPAPPGSKVVLEFRMFLSALPDPDLQVRSPGRRAGTRRQGKPEARPPTRNALVADFLALCQLDPEVESLRAPAPKAEFELGGETVAHVADFELVRDGIASLIDVAADADLERHPLRAATVRGAVALDGRRFAIKTAQSIRAEPRFGTVRLILACRRTPVTAGDRVRILHQLDECGAMRLVDCAGTVMNTRDGVAAVLALACEGLVAVDINGMILPETQVRRRKVPYSDPFAF